MQQHHQPDFTLRAAHGDQRTCAQQQQVFKTYRRRSASTAGSTSGSSSEEDELELESVSEDWGDAHSRPRLLLLLRSGRLTGVDDLCLLFSCKSTKSLTQQEIGQLMRAAWGCSARCQS